MERKFSEFSKFRESDQSLEHEFWSILILAVTRALLAVW